MDDIQKEVLKKMSKKIDKIQESIASILMLKDESSYSLIIGMTEEIANIAYKFGSTATIPHDNSSADGIHAIGIKYILHEDENGTIFSDEELEIKGKNIGYVYVLKDGNNFRAGKAIDVKKRVKTHHASNPNLELFYVSSEIEHHSNMETMIHRLDYKIVKGEWKECSDFNELLSTIKKIETTFTASNIKT